MASYKTTMLTNVYKVYVILRQTPTPYTTGGPDVEYD